MRWLHLPPRIETKEQLVRELPLVAEEDVSDGIFLATNPHLMVRVKVENGRITRVLKT